MKAKLNRCLLCCVLWLLLASALPAHAFYNPSAGRWLSRDPIEEKGGIHLLAFAQNDGLNRFDALGQQVKWNTKGFNADAYGLVPWSLSFGFTVAIVQGAVGGSIEVVYDCADGTAEAYGVAWIGAGLSTPGTFFSVSVGKGLNFIYNLPTATAYAGDFVAVTGSATAGTLGGYGTLFTTPLGVVNLANTGSVGSETWGFGAGWTAGTPGAGVLLQYQYYWDLGSVPFSAQQRATICRCKGAPPGTVPSQQIRGMAVTAGESKKSDFKQKLKDSLPWSLSSSGAKLKVDQASWEENVW